MKAEKSERANKYWYCIYFYVAASWHSAFHILVLRFIRFEGI